MDEMKAETSQSDVLINQLQQQLADALEKHNNHISQVSLDDSASSSAMHERHQQSIVEKEKQMEELHLRHTADLQSLKHEHELELQSLKTFEGAQRNEWMAGLARQDVNETTPLITVTAAKDSDLVDGQEVTTDLAVQTKANDALTSVEKVLALF